MIVHDFNLKCIAFRPDEANAVLIVDPDGVLGYGCCTGPYGRRLVELNEFAAGDSFDGLKPAHETIAEKLFRVGIGERANQMLIV
jgi:hypothetical protein